MSYVYNPSPRKMPTKNAIRQYWAERLDQLFNRFDSLCDMTADGDACFGCGFVWAGGTERAHILARSEGGTDGEENLHLLCRRCHCDSEFLSGEAYWAWFAKGGCLAVVWVAVQKE